MKLKDVEQGRAFKMNGELWVVTYKETAGMYYRRLFDSNGDYTDDQEVYGYGDENVELVTSH